MILDSIDYKIISLISNGAYHSGQQLAEILGTSRAAVNKRVNKINSFFSEQTKNSYNISTITGKGYCLNQSFDFLCIEKIKQDLTKEIKNNLDLEFFPVIDSTNTYLINKVTADHHLVKDNNKFHVCLCEMQTVGRGRTTISRHKSWCSPFGNNIYCSISWNYLGNQNSLIGLSIIAGLTVVELIDSVYSELPNNTIGIKWPNDIVINDKKVAGILTEIIGDPNGGCKVIIGFGINVWKNYNSNLLNIINENIEQSWASISEYLIANNNNVSNNIKSLVSDITRNNIISNLINRFITNYYNFIANGLAEFLDKWHKYDVLKNRIVDVETPGLIKTGVAAGIDQQGALLVEIQGSLQAFYSGDVSVKCKQMVSDTK